MTALLQCSSCRSTIDEMGVKIWGRGLASNLESPCVHSMEYYCIVSSTWIMMQL